MLEHPTIPDKDKPWLVLRDSVMTDRGLRLFAVDCAKRAQTYPKNYTPDPRTLKAIEVSERFANGEATEDALRAAATAAAYAAYAAYAAAADAADAAYATAAYAAAAAAYAAYAAYNRAAYDAYTDAAHDAYTRAAADAAAYAADADAVERSKQVEYLIALTEKPGMFEVGK
jgi:hypothetical protein